jgi:tRNA 2-thiouridine synthesizing protein D
MNHFLIIVTKAPYSTNEDGGNAKPLQNGLHAREFCMAAQKLGHKVEQIFFYQEGVFHTTNNTTSPLSSELELRHWQGFFEKTQIPLRVCITAAQVRGLNTDEPYPSAVDPIFDVCGMADFFAVMNATENTTAKKIITVQF